MPTNAREIRALRRAVRRAPVVSAAAARTRRRRSEGRIRRSGLFDDAWYRAQLDPTEHVDDAVAHFVAVGAARGLQPHPLFDPDHYAAADAAARRSTADPFTHFLAGGARRGHDPHPLFDAELVAGRHREARAHPHGPFGWYLEDPDRSVPPPTSLLTEAEAPTPAAYLALVREVHARHAAVPDHRTFPRSVPAFDHAAGAAFVAEMGRRAGELDPPPLVSVVVPTRDRAAMLPAALGSVLAQSWPHLELLVVDDGSTDATAEVVAALGDDRVRYLPQDPHGVSEARNHGLREARGTYIAYLDSDNAWRPETLRTMVGFLASEGFRAGYSAIELHSEAGTEYRAAPFDRAALRERNYIDCNVLVHERSLIDEVGGFDVALRRVVDWDLVLRIAEVTELGFAGFVSTRYAGEEERADRITVAESVGYRFEVRAKHLVDWAGAPPPVAGRTSVCCAVRDVDPDPGRTVARLLRDHLDGGDVEVVAVDDGTATADALQLRLLEVAIPGVRVVRIADRVNLTTALDVAAATASGDVVVIADPVAAISADVLQVCADEVRAGVATAIQPRYVNLDGTVASTGSLTTADGVTVAVGDGLAEHDAFVEGPTVRDAVDGFGFAVDARRFRDVGGLAPLLGGAAADVDLGRRLRETGGTLAVSRVAAQLEAWPTIRRHLPTHADGRELARRGGSGTTATFEAYVAAVGELEVAGFTTAPAPRFSYRGPQRWSATFVRRLGDRRRWAIKTATPDLDDREAWGDWHFGVALRDALEELGEHAVVDLRRGWHRPSSHLDDIDLVLRGTQRYEPPPGRTSILWVISHPDAIDRDEVAAFDGVFVASDTYVDEAARRWARPVEPLLQATDPARFHVAPDPDLATPLLFVGNSRGVRRRVVADAIEAGLTPAIYGAGWDGLVPAELVHGTHIPNDQLGRYYASAEVVLADHWDDMRDRGFVANRLFDAVAAGACVVSDEVAGLDGLFGGAVRTYRDASDLADAVAAARAWRREGGRVDATGHTFVDRAAALVRWADDHAASRA